MILGVDATALLGKGTGIARYTAGLLTGLSELSGTGDAADLSVVLTAFTIRDSSPLTTFADRRTTVRHRRMSNRVLNTVWQHVDWPHAELFCGPVDVFHGLRFVLPPLRDAAGVVTIYDLAFIEHADTVSRPSLAYQRLVPRSLRRAGAVCTPTSAVADALVQRYDVDPARVVVTPLGLSRNWLANPRPASSAWLAEHGIPSDYLLFVGTTEPRKNLPLLAAAHESLAAAPPLVLAGPAGWGPQVASDRIRRAGYLDEQALVGLVAAARCLILPSRHEGFGLPPLEALACGVPVVVSDIPTHREVLGPYARYVAPGDVVALSAAMAEVLEQDRDAGADARRAHAAHYTWAGCAAAAIKAYTVAGAHRS